MDSLGDDLMSLRNYSSCVLVEGMLVAFDRASKRQKVDVFLFLFMFKSCSSKHTLLDTRRVWLYRQ